MQDLMSLSRLLEVEKTSLRFRSAAPRPWQSPAVAQSAVRTIHLILARMIDRRGCQETVTCSLFYRPHWGPAGCLWSLKADL